MHKDFPVAIERLSKGHAYDLKSNIFERLPQIFYDEKPRNGFPYIQILGRESGSRVYKYIREDYVNTVCNLDKYKIFLPKANRIGKLGKVLPAPVIAGLSCEQSEIWEK